MLEPEPEPPPVLEPEPEPPPVAPEPRYGGSVRVALSSTELDARARRMALERWESRATSLLDHIEFLEPEGIGPAELLLLGEADLALIHGRQVSRVLAAGDHRVVRAAGWDRSFALLCDPTARWTNDPNFRRWLAETVDRADLVEHLFLGLGAPVFSLLERTGEARWAPPVVRPFGSTTRPVLDIGFDPRDPDARSIAARMKASFAIEGLELRLVEDLGTETPELTLVAHQHWGDDALESFAPLVPTAAGGALWYLYKAETAEGESRRSFVALAQDALLIDARLIPLVRVDAWLAVSPGLQDFEPGWSGDLALEKIWWMP